MASTSPRELDLVFICDCTGSMGGYIASAQQNIKNIVEGIMAEEKCDVQFGLIEYRDHPPQDSSFVTRVHDFTSSVKTMKGYVDQMSAAGGGDGPECVTCGMVKALEMPYRKSAAKVVVMISDAPPHGLEPTGDGFPNGCPTGADPLEVARSMGEAGIVVYAVAVEPNISSFVYARDFMRSVAKITGGQYLPLSSADLLTKVIIGGAAEQMSLESLVEQVAAEARQLREAAGTAGLAGAPPPSEAEIATKVAEKMQASKVQTMHVAVDDLYGGRYNMSNADALYGASKLSSVKPMLTPISQPSPTGYSSPSAAYGSYPTGSLSGGTMPGYAPSMPYPSSPGTMPGYASSMPYPPPGALPGSAYPTSAPMPAPYASPLDFGGYPTAATTATTADPFALSPASTSAAYPAPPAGLSSMPAPSLAPQPPQSAGYARDTIATEQVARMITQAKHRGLY